MVCQLLPSRCEIFDDICSRVDEVDDVGNQMVAAEKHLLDQARRKYPKIDELTYDDYIEYLVTKDQEDNERESQATPIYDEKKLWRELQNHPLENHEDATWLANFLENSYFPRIIELGKLDGVTPLRFSPRNCSFEDDTIICLDGHQPVSTGVLAVNYHHHPSTDGTQSASSDESTLRRFEQVGCILAYGMNGWDRTGHVLVIDMGPGRSRQPWIILASAWEEDDGAYGTDTVSAPRKVPMNDTRARGIFPQHSNRTTIARVNTLSDDPNTTTPLLLQFGSDFSFRLDEFGFRSTKGIPEGPELACVMPWVKKLGWEEWQQVCYLDDDGIQEFMRYDARTHVYHPVDGSQKHLQQRQPLTTSTS
ncbi:MAG: hypothetical protein Q9221_006343 [Calogaya cf. arnoldii]